MEFVADFIIKGIVILDINANDIFYFLRGALFFFFLFSFFFPFPC